VRLTTLPNASVGSPLWRVLGYPCDAVRRGRCTAGCPSGQRERSVKPSAQPTLVRTQHLPRYFRRSEPVSPDGGTGFCVPQGAVHGPLVKVLGQPWARSGSPLLFASCSNIAFEQGNDYRPRCCAGLVSACSAGRRRARRGSHGRIADGVRAHRGRCNRSPFRGVARLVQPLASAESRGRAFRGRARTRSSVGLEDLADLLIEEVVAAVDAVAVDGEQDRDAVPGPGGDLGGRLPGCRPVGASAPPARSAAPSAR
jgi:hypothetical protein